MTNSWLLLLPMFIIAHNVLRRRRSAAQSQSVGSADERTLLVLAEAGADLSKEAEIEFLLYFPTKAHAESAAVVARRESFAALVSSPTEPDALWSCILRRRMVPSIPAIEAMRTRLEDLAASLDGEFDGWEAAVEP